MTPPGVASSRLEEICRSFANNNNSFDGLSSSLLISNASSFSEVSDVLKARPHPAQVWGIGILAVTLVSCCAAVGIGLMPLLSRRLYHRVLTFCVGLGVGSLSGTAVFHLLPQAFELGNSDSEHGYIFKSWMAVAGIYLFFFIDKFLKVITEYRKVKQNEAKCRSAENGSSRKEIPLVSFTHSDSTPSTTSANSTTLLLPSKDSFVNGTLAPVPEEELETISVDGVTQADARQAHGMCSHDHDVNFHQGDSVIATVAWMIIFGDGLHNFIDGLSIGAAFSKRILTGVSVSLAVLCEEFPHELGDVAILVNAGMTLRQALTYNMLSAATCYVGFVIGVLLGELEQATPYIFALAGGMFLYISLASMVPEMNNASDRHLSKSLNQGLRAIGLQASGVLIGLLAMFVMAYYSSAFSVA